MMTPRQSQVLHFVAKFIAEHSFSPSADEIRIGINLKSKSGVARIFPALKEQGLITYISRRARSVKLTALGLQTVGAKKLYAGRCPTCGTPYAAERK